MQQKSKLDQLAITGPLPGRNEKRFYCKEISDFLQLRSGQLEKWASGQGLLHEARAKGPNGRGWRRTIWLTERGMIRAIAHFRAFQGERVVKKRQIRWNRTRWPNGLI